MMKKMAVSLLALVLAWTLTPWALAEQNVVYQETEGLSGYTVESYPEAWITAYKVKNILEGKKRNPPAFLHIVPPQGAVPRLFDWDRAMFWVPQTQMSYTYLVEDPSLLKNFLKYANEKKIVDEGKDKMKAIYLGNENHRIYGLLTLPDTYYSEHAKLKVHIADLTQTMSDDALIQAMNEEILRLQGALTFETLEKYWSQDQVNQVQITLPEANALMQVETKGLVVLGANENNLNCMYMNEAGKAKTLAFRLDLYSFPHRQEKAADLTLGGVEAKVYSKSGHHSVALPLGDVAGMEGMTLYLLLEIEAGDDEMPAVAADAFARVTLGEMP